MSQPLINKIGSLYCNNLHSDIIFVIEEEAVEFPAHKFVIGFGSDQLYRMVYGNDTTLGTSTIVVPNCSSTDFLDVLKYLYTGDMEWSLDNCSSVLEVGRYFGITELENSFNSFLAETINFDSALEVYQRHFHKNNIICRTAMKVIQLVLHEYLKADPAKFFEMPEDAVSQILQMDELAIDENKLFLEMITWANSIGCESIPPVIGNVLKMIRFVNMADLKTTISSEIQGVINPRWEIKVVKGSAAKDDKEFNADNSAETIVIHSSRTIRLHGLATFSLEPIFAQTNNQCKVIPCYRSRVFQNDGIYDVMFENSITIPENTYTRLQVPVSCVRYTFDENDFFSIQAFQNGNKVNDLPIAAMFVSTSKL